MKLDYQKLLDNQRKALNRLIAEAEFIEEQKATVMNNINRIRRVSYENGEPV